LIALILSAVLAAAPPAASCRYQGGDSKIKLDGHPFQSLPTADGCWIFVSVQGGKGWSSGSITILKNEAGHFERFGSPRLPATPHGIAFSRDERYLVVAADEEVDVLDTKALLSGAARYVVGRLPLDRNAGAINVALTPDDSALFVAEEDIGKAAYIDFKAAESKGFRNVSVAKSLFVGQYPVGLAVSSAGDRLYVTTEAGSANGRKDCAGEGDLGQRHSEGWVSVINVQKFELDPRGALESAVYAGCSPVRAKLSSNGAQLWVTARGENAVYQFDTGGADGGHRLHQVKRFATGDAPVGLAISPAGDRVCVSESYRFNPQHASGLRCIENGTNTRSFVLGAGAFPRDVVALPQQDALVVSEFGASILEILPYPN
jgi:DNA-binding beta-propeller fold protein YncE